MIPVEQRLLYNPDTGERGDCMKCCFASLLEYDYDDVPHFAAMGDMWWTEMTNWLAGLGWRLHHAWFSVADDNPAKIAGYTEGYWIASVISPRTRADGSHLGHSIVMHNNQVAWDPHPLRDEGHLGFTEGQFLAPIDPARFVLLP